MLKLSDAGLLRSPGYIATGEDAARIGGQLSADGRAVAKVERHIADAVAHGARIACGGKRHALGGRFFEPTVLTEVSQQMQIAREETFGPVAPLFRFHSESQALQMANDTEFGLAAYFYTRDLSRAWRVARRTAAVVCVPRRR